MSSLKDIFNNKIPALTVIGIFNNKIPVEFLDWQRSHAILVHIVSHCTSRCTPQPQGFSTRRCKLSTTTTLTQQLGNGEIPHEPHCVPQQCLSQVADLLSLQRAICRAARSNACTILPWLDEDLSVLARKTFPAEGYSRHWRFGMQGSLYAGSVGSVAVVCW